VAAFSVSVAQRRVVALVLLCVVAAVVVLRQHHPAARAGSALRVAPIRPSQSGAGGSAAKKEILVDVVGAVTRPGLYHLAVGARVADAVARAGGLTRHAERTAVNLAAPLADGEQLLVAARGAAVAGAAGAGGPAGSTAAPVSLSMATAEQLDSLPGVGPVTAQKIIAFREQNGPFTSVEALDAIPGIGPARIADLKGLVVP
jgi:competence protein ComEA